MRQVPYYLLIGNGHVANHFQYYFSLLKLQYVLWKRSDGINCLNRLVTLSSHILLLITDDQIDAFIKRYLTNSDKFLIHFSGSLSSEFAIGAHPLMTFNQKLYDYEIYCSIPFILDHDASPFNKLLPGLPNRSVYLNKRLKAKYHAMCVLSGNLSCFVWQKLFSLFKDEFNFSETFVYPYLLQQTQNLIDNSALALTGPLIRKDNETIKKNLLALKGNPLFDLYQAFVTCYNKSRKKNHEH